MTIERQRRIAEQKHVVRNDLASPAGIGRGDLRLRYGIGSPRAFAVDEVLLLRQGQTFAIADLMAHEKEDERARTPFLEADITDARLARDRVPDMKRTVELQAAACIHSTRQRDGRKKPASPGVSIRAEFGPAVDR